MEISISGCGSYLYSTHPPMENKYKTEQINAAIRLQAAQYPNPRVKENKTDQPCFMPGGISSFFF